MDTTLPPGTLMTEQNRQVTETLARERGRLRNFIRKRVADPADAEDILQDVFHAFVEAYRLPVTIELAGAWLYRVARNRIVDRLRKKRTDVVVELPEDTEEGSWLESVLPSVDAGPEAAYARKVLLEELYAALEDLPATQRDVFLANEIEGQSFRELAEASGISINTLLGRKHAAVRHLRARLQAIYESIVF